MKKRLVLAETAIEEDLRVDLTIHDVPAKLLTEFAQKIANLYYRGNLNKALKELMEKALTEQTLVQKHIKTT